MTNEQAEQSKFEGWAILEIFGHQRYAGFVSTQVFGTAVMFRVDVPALEERERVTKRPGYMGAQYVPAGATVKEGAVQGYTKLFGVGAIYAMTPCTQEAALKAVESMQERLLMLVTLPPEKAIEAPKTEGAGDLVSDDAACTECGEPVDECECDENAEEGEG